VPDREPDRETGPQAPGEDVDAKRDDEAFVIAALTGVGPARAELAVGIGDDAAVFSDGRVVTTDTMIEGIHWDAHLSPGDVGWKLVAVNASDVGAMGGRPEWALLTLSLPSPLDRAWVREFAAGTRAACEHWGITLVGGDTTGSPGPRVATLMLHGRAERPVLRSGGRPGDRVWVTGELGRAAEAFLSDAPSPGALAHFRRPEPPVAFGAALGASGLATAMMDLSDGLAADLTRLAAASRVGAVLDPSAVPGARPLAWRTSFGEDYEFLFTSPPEASEALVSLAARNGVTVTPIGVLTADLPVRLRGRSWPAPLFSHFRTPPSREDL
jgi:thiamine-monophosphate kinase